MNKKTSFIKFLQSPWIAALFLLGIFLTITQYKFGWDDQHLEIPLLKSLIDPTLYSGDYYIESLKQNFSSFFYPVLAKLIKVDHIPTVYFWLYVLSRYFLFYFCYKIWLLISRNRLHAFCAVLVFILMARVDEFLYRTFSHQEFALAIIFGGIYYFFKERFIKSALFLGLAANFHGLYSLFPMFFMTVYLLTHQRKHGWSCFFKTHFAFLIFSLPFFIWTLQSRLTHSVTTHDPDWLALFITACPQNFFYPKAPLIPLKTMLSDFRIFYELNQPYIYLVALFILNLTFNPRFKENKKAVSACVAGFFLLFLSLAFTYFYPSKFIIDLNLIRNMQFLLFFLMGFTSLFLFEKIEKETLLTAFISGIVFTFLKYHYPATTSAIVILFFFLLITRLVQNKGGALNRFLIAASLGIILYSCYILILSFRAIQLTWIISLNLFLILASISLVYLILSRIATPQQTNRFRKLFFLIPLIVFIYQYGYYRVQKSQEEQLSGGFWQLQRSWEDMQRYTKMHTPKDAMIFIPYNMEMGGFRMFSDRRILVCYRDCGIIGFDYAAAVEWRKRIGDVQSFKVGVNQSVQTAVKNAIFKYKADYIVFMRYAMPKENNEALELVYVNQDFALFKVKIASVLKNLK